MGELLVDVYGLAAAGEKGGGTEVGWFVPSSVETVLELDLAPDRGDKIGNGEVLLRRDKRRKGAPTREHRVHGAQILIRKL